MDDVIRNRPGNRPVRAARDPSDGTPTYALAQQLHQAAAIMRRAPQLKPRNAPPEPPVPGTVEHHRQAMQWAHTLDGVRQLGSPDRAAVERAWSGAIKAVEQKHGIRPSLDLVGQPSALAVQALEAARSAEDQFLRLSSAGGDAFGGTTDAAFKRFTGAVADWLNIATRDWETAGERRRREEAMWR